MERLTQRTNGVVVYVGAHNKDAVGQTPFEVSSRGIREILARLAEYEDTGLTPEGVEALKLSMMGKTAAEIKEFDGLLSLKTNADCIRTMSDEELAEFLDTTQKMECEAFHVINSDGTLKFESLKNGWLEWLRQPVEGVE